MDGPGKREGTDSFPGVLRASRRFHLVFIALTPNPISCPKPASHTLLISFVVLSPLIPPQGNEELCHSSRMDQRFFQPRRLVGDSQGTEPGGHPQILCPTKETHSLKGLRKQCVQWTIMIAAGRSGSPGPIAWTQPVEDEGWTQRTSAR